MFEYGATRKKHANTASIKYLPVLAANGFILFLVGYGLAYGRPYFIGKEHFLSTFEFEESDMEHEKQWVLLFAGASMTVSLAISGVVERAKLLVPFGFSIVIALIIVPFISAWTFGGGFLQELGY